jgi:hypothetical protein
MKHLTEEEMIEHYYAEGFSKPKAELHLQACKSCLQTYEELGSLLGGIRAPESPDRGPQYGAQVWESIQGSLQPYSGEHKRRFFLWPQLAYPATCLLLLAFAFLAGRTWEHFHTKAPLASAPQQAKERVVLFVLDNHLDRSERLLVHLNHANASVQGADLPLQVEARQLLTDNRLYLQSVDRTNDPVLAAALDHLERVLLEIANSPDALSKADITRIEKQMNTQDLLFQIRVLHTKVSEAGTGAPVLRKGETL